LIRQVDKMFFRQIGPFGFGRNARGQNEFFPKPVRKVKRDF
jgi:hypothetical protein